MKHATTYRNLLLFFPAVFCLLAIVPFFASAAPLSVEIVGAGSNMVNVVQATPVGAAGRAPTLQKGIANNMSLLPFVTLINPNGIPGGASLPSAQPDAEELKRFMLAKVHFIITANWINSSQVELRCFETGGGRFLFGNRYAVGGNDEAVLDVADQFCADFLEAVIGRGDFFRSTLAFVKNAGKGKRDIWSVRPNGRRLSRLTNIQGEAISPAWSPDGRRVIFTHISKRSHGLGIYDFTSRSVRRVRFDGNTVIGPTFMPNGMIAVGLTDGKNPSIFQLSGNFQKGSKLADSGSIDVSPSVDASGTQMAFTSSRLGGPQIFVKNLASGTTRRVSMSGNYNTDPSISPDGKMVTYARRMGGGHRIFVQDLTTGQERQLTFGPGSDEEPSFGPDSYFIVFMSTRGGKKELYVTTRNGGQPRRLPTGQGDASFPAWGPSSK